jgi:hypothetical protein
MPINTALLYTQPNYQYYCTLNQTIAIMAHVLATAPKHYAMKAWRGVEVKLTALLTSALRVKIIIFVQSTKWF